MYYFEVQMIPPIADIIINDTTAIWKRRRLVLIVYLVLFMLWFECSPDYIKSDDSIMIV